MDYPPTIGGSIDALYELRERRLALQKQVDEMKEQEGALNDHILESFSKAECDGAKGKVATAAIARRTVAQVEDWDVFYEYVASRKAFDLLQRRCNDAAYRERLEQSVEIPGVKPYTVTSLSLTKSKR